MAPIVPIAAAVIALAAWAMRKREPRVVSLIAGRKYSVDLESRGSTDVNTAAQLLAGAGGRVNVKSGTKVNVVFIAQGDVDLDVPGEILGIPGLVVTDVKEVD
jgi:hypothetical protein